MKLQNLIDLLTALKATVGADALVYTGSVQSGERVLVAGVEILSKSELAHYGWRTPAGFTTWKDGAADDTDDTEGIEINYTGVEIV
jgi:hypothetical protein